MDARVKPNVKTRYRSQGQTIVEFALALPVFLLMLIGTLEGGWLLFNYNQVTNAAREGARYAAAQGSESGDVNSPGEIRPIVLDRVAGLDESRFALDANWPGDASRLDNCEPGSNSWGCPVEVTVTYEFQPITGMIFGTQTIEMRAQSDMRIHF